VIERKRERLIDLDSQEMVTIQTQKANHHYYHKEVRISVNKTLTKKLIYVVAALTLLALLIPAMAVPVSATGETLTMKIVNGPFNPGNLSANNWVADGITYTSPYKGEGFNVSGSVVQVTAAGFTAPITWSLENVTTVPGYQAPQWYPNGTPPLTSDTVAYISGVWGEAKVKASDADASLSVTKKWGMIDHTEIGTLPPTYVTWNEGAKAFGAVTGNLTDLVIGSFLVNAQQMPYAVQGVILNWYLVTAEANVPMAQGLAQNLKTTMSNLTKAQYVEFVTNKDVNPWSHPSSDWLGTNVTTYTDDYGKSSVNLGAWFEENVQVVVVPEYPTDPNRFVTPELTSANFATYEYESVPQVRWAGEKIVLEANFGNGKYTSNSAVKFYFQNQSVGTLEGIGAANSYAATIWTSLNSDGIASAILTSNISGQVDVVAALYPEGQNGAMTNQHSFRVYFLNFYSLTLRDVNGKRSNHNDGDWTVANPYSNNFPGVATTDMLAQTANVSQDTLERAQVRGWFMPAGAQKSSRAETNVDLDADGTVLANHDMDDVVIGAGHYVLPDDWVYLMGSDPLRRLHWDIMDSPGDTVKAAAALGPYYKGATTNFVAEASVVGPFAPGIEKMTPNGWMYNNPKLDNWVIPGTSIKPRQINTVVPNGVVDFWDAPMPPAKVVFEIQSGAGYFKDALKTGIYYTGTGSNKEYTEPFYEALIPAHWAIPPFNNEFGGGYDWNSFDGVHGNYAFWKIINQPTAGAPVLGDAMHPTRVEVYSDNHGEAMVYLNGNFNLALDPTFNQNGAADIQPGYTVGTTTLRAMADYPYIRTDQLIKSNTVTKTWTWGGMILGADNTHVYMPQGQGLPVLTWPAAGYMGVNAGKSRMVLSSGTFDSTSYQGTYPNEMVKSNKKAIWVWVCDRDGKQSGVLGAKVEWNVGGVAPFPKISGANNSLGGYNRVTQNIFLENGFLAGTNGSLTGSLDGTQGVSILKDPALSPVLTQDFENDTAPGSTIANAYKGKTALQALFYKFYNPTMAASGLQPNDFAVAMIEVQAQGGAIAGSFNVVMNITSKDFGLTGANAAYGWLPGVNYGRLTYNTNCQFDYLDPIDDAPSYGDANLDGVINMGDVTAIERMILGLTYANVNADINITNSIDMGDVVSVERKILGY